MAGACSLVERIHERYFDDDEAECEYILPHFSSSPCKLSERGLERVVLNNMNINDVGDVSKLSEYVKNVLEVDLAWNRLSDWKHVVTMCNNLPMLRIFNISFNPLSGALPIDFPTIPKLHTLILNGTNLPFSVIAQLVKKCPNLLELHLSHNVIDFDVASTSEEEPISVSLKTVHFNKCGITDWEQVMSLIHQFPNRQTVFLSENPISKIVKVGGKKALAEQKGLQTLVLSKTELTDWGSIDLLEEFPDLTEIRLNNTPILEDLKDEEKMHLVTARLRKLKMLNGSVISEEQRETAERFFIRYYQDQKERPSHYDRLVEKHGKVEKLAKVDLTPKSHVSVEVVCEETNYKANIRLNVSRTVSQFMRSLEKVTSIPYARMRLFYEDQEDPMGPTEIRFPNQQIRSLHVEDGDRFIVQSKIVATRKRSQQKDVNIH